MKPIEKLKAFIRKVKPPKKGTTDRFIYDLGQKGGVDWRRFRRNK